MQYVNTREAHTGVHQSISAMPASIPKDKLCPAAAASIRPGGNKLKHSGGGAYISCCNKAAQQQHLAYTAVGVHRGLQPDSKCP